MNYNHTRINQLLDQLDGLKAGGRYHSSTPKPPTQPSPPRETFPKYDPIHTETYGTSIGLEHVATLAMAKAGLNRDLLSDEVMVALERTTIEFEKDSCGDTTIYVNWRTDVPNASYKMAMQRWEEEQASYEKDLGRYEAELEAHITKLAAEKQALLEMQEKAELERLLKKYGKA